MGLFRNAVTVLSASMVRIPLAFLTGVVVARWLDLDERGFYSVVMGVAALGTMVAVLGWPSAAIFRLRRLETPVRTVLGMTLLALVLFAGTTVSLGVVFQDPLSRWLLEGEPVLLLFVGLAIVPLRVAMQYFSAICRGLMRFDLHAAQQIAMALLTLAFMVVALIVWDGGALDALGAAALGTALPALGLFGWLVRKYGVDFRFRVTEFLRSTSFGLKGWSHAVAGTLHEKVDTFMLMAILGDPVQVALYAQAVAVLTFIKLLPEALASALLPQLASATPAEAARQAATAIRHGTFGMVLSCIVAGLFGPFFIPLVYGQDYQGSVAPFLLLLPGVAFLTVYRLLTRYWVAIDRQRVNIVLQFTSMPLNVGLNLWLIPRHGILGAALASVISYTFEGIVMAVIFMLYARKGPVELFVIQRADLALYRKRLARFLPFLRA